MVLNFGLIKSKAQEFGKQIKSEFELGKQQFQEGIKNPLGAGIPESTDDTLILGSAASALPTSSFAGLGGVVVDEAGEVTFKTGKFFLQNSINNANSKLNQFNQYATNSKTNQLTKSYISKVMEQLKKPKSAAFITVGAISAIIGSYPWAEWAQTEAMEIINFANKAAIDSGDPVLIQETLDVQEEILDDNVWESIARVIPAANIAVGFMKKFKALKQQAKINRVIAEDEIEKLRNGTTEEDLILKRQKEFITFKEDSDRRIQTLIEERQNRQRLLDEAADIREQERIEERQIRQFERDKELIELENEYITARIEQEERIQREYLEGWMEYLRLKIEAFKSNTPSSLSFGLL